MVSFFAPPKAIELLRVSGFVNAISTISGL
jgi:hypothetical protein